MIRKFPEHFGINERPYTEEDKHEVYHILYLIF